MRELVNNWTSLKMSALCQLMSREDKPQTGKIYVQKTHLIINIQNIQVTLKTQQ